MNSLTKTISISTKKAVEMVNITSQVFSVVEESGIQDGFTLVCSPHTTTALLVNENEPNLLADMEGACKDIIPWQAKYRHNALDGNAPSHLVGAFIGSDKNFIVEKGKVLLGTWQSIFLVELDGPRSRKVFVKVIGD